MTGDLVEFLRARLDEDYEVAQREGTHRDGSPIDAAWWARVAGDADSTLVEMFSPARVLAEVEAKRAMLDEHQPNAEPYSWVKCSRCVETMAGRYQEDWEPQKYPCRTLRLLALPYADHPDYREEWRP